MPMPAMENVALWHERDISHSSVERMIGPDATVTLDFALMRLAGVIDKLVVYPQNMQKNLDRLGGLVHSQRVLLALTQKGVSREDAYRLVQRNAMPVWRGEGDFLDAPEEGRRGEGKAFRRRARGTVRPRLSPQARRHDLQAGVRGSVIATMGNVTAVSLNSGHTFSKRNVLSIRLLAGLGVDGDAHAGEKVKHRSRVRRDPSQPNLRQVHLVHSELFDELRDKGFSVVAGDIGENVTTRGIDLLALPTGTRLRLGDTATVEVTGLRNPCVQLDGFQKGLMAATLDKDQSGNLIRKAGVMSIVITGGEIRPGDAIAVELPTGVHAPLQPV